NLGKITLLEFRPLFRIVAEPLAQLRARRQILRPVMDARVFLLHAARPQPIQQHAPTIGIGRLFVGTLDANVHVVILRPPGWHNVSTVYTGEKTMPLEIYMLAAATLLALLAFLPASLAKAQTHGRRWLASNRDPEGLAP